MQDKLMELKLGKAATYYAAGEGAYLVYPYRESDIGTNVFRAVIFNTEADRWYNLNVPARGLSPGAGTRQSHHFDSGQSQHAIRKLFEQGVKYD